MAAWDDGMAPDVGNASVNTALFTLQGTAPGIGNASVSTALFALQGMAPDVGIESVVAVGYYASDPTIITITPDAVVVPHFAYSEPSIITVLPLEQVVVHFAYNVEVTTITINTPAEPVIKWKYVGTNTISVLPISTVIPKWKYSTPTIIEILTPSIIIFHCGKPYLVKASLQIDGVDYSGDLFGAVNVNMSDGSTTTFSFNLYSTQIPSDFVGKEATISYQAADDTGIVSNTETIVIGVIREASVNIDKPTLIEISGYDYAGYHNELGQLYSGEITRILTGTIGITSAGALATGKSPIFNVAYIEAAIVGVQDGTDYYVDALSGIIYIPVSSKLLTAPASLQFQYVDPYESFNAMAQSIADIKGWTIEHDGFTVSDYTEPKKQPIIALSNESVVDILKKLYEIGGGKLDSSLFPTLRIYNEKIKYEGAEQRQFTEADIIFDSLQMRCSLFDVLTDQTVKSVQNTYSNVVVGDFAEIKNESGSVDNSDWYQGVGLGLWFTGGIYSKGNAYTNAVAIANTMGRRDFITVSIPIGEIGEYSFTPGGSQVSYHAIYTRYEYDGGTFVKWYQQVSDKNSVTGTWRVETDLENKVINFILSSTPVIDEVELDYVQYPDNYIGVFAIYYRRIDWQISISTKSVDYGEGVATTQVQVSGTQAVQKIDIKLEGDVYEQPFIETQTQGEDLCKAILHEKKFIYSASASLPLHKAGALKLGNKTEILSRGKSVIGNLKNIAYNIDTESGAGIVGIEIKGLGSGI